MDFEVPSNPNRQEWDNFVVASPYGHFMQSHAWGVLQRELGWKPFYLLWRDKGEIRAVALLLARGLPGVRIFYAPRGPVVDFADREATNAVVSGMKEFVGRERGIFLRMDPYVSAPELERGKSLPADLIEVPRAWSYWNAPKFVFWLDLRGDEEALFKRLASGCRNEVRLGYRNGVEFSLGDESDLESFYRLMAVTGQHKGIGFHGRDYYRRLLSVVNGSARVQMFLGRHDGKIITTGISVQYGRTAWLLYAASDPGAYKLRANRAQQWEMIKWARAAGCERYDFRGTAANDPPSPDDPGYGVYKFKKSFGPEYIRMAGYFDMISRPVAHRLFRLAEDELLPAAYKVRIWLDERRGVGGHE